VGGRGCVRLDPPGGVELPARVAQSRLGSVFTTLHLPHADKAAELLGIPAGVTQAALVPVAYFTGEDFKPAARRPMEEITYWNGWKQTR